MNAYNWFCFFTTLCSARVGARFPSPIVFPEEEITTIASAPKEMPLDLALMLSNVTDLDDLFRNYIDDYSRPPIVVGARIGGDMIERSSKGIKAAKVARCQPEQVTVPLTPPQTDVSTIYYPPCTRVARCGGCCVHDLLSCQPVDVEILQMEVVVTQYRGGRSLSFLRKDVVSVEQHKTCKCDCKLKETDCTPSQRYIKDECRCACNNVDKQEKCKEESATKLWNPNECACVCRDTLDCPSGFYFDRYKCDCVPERRRASPVPATRYDYYNGNV